MKPRKRSLADYLAAEMPTELQWRNRPPHGQAETAWCGRRFAWCVLHNVDALDLIRNDARQKRNTP
jgi:hypothetical protein